MSEFWLKYKHHFSRLFFILLGQAITELEASMKSSLEEILVQLPDVHQTAQFNKIDLFVVLQALVGFVTGTKERDSLALLGTALKVIGHFASKCKLDRFKTIRTNSKNG